MGFVLLKANLRPQLFIVTNLHGWYLLMVISIPMFGECSLVFPCLDDAIPISSNDPHPETLFWHTIWKYTWHIYIYIYIYILYIYICVFRHSFGIYSNMLSNFFLAFYLASFQAFILAFYLASSLTFYLAFYLTLFLTFFLAFYLTFFLAFYLTFYVTSCTRNWGPAVPTEIWSSRLRSGSAHWDLALAVEVRQCPLRSGARGWGPAVPTEIWSSRLRAVSEAGGGGRRGRQALIKSKAARNVWRKHGSQTCCRKPAGSRCQAMRAGVQISLCALFGACYRMVLMMMLMMMMMPLHVGKADQNDCYFLHGPSFLWDRNLP